MAAIDNVISEYAGILEKIYNERTAGDSTFTGVLAQFLLEANATS